MAGGRIWRTGSPERCPDKHMNWSRFFFMGGYAFYVWGSYGVTLVLLGGEVLMLLKRKRNLAKRERSLG
jgi:heme exporter protein D